MVIEKKLFETYDWLGFIMHKTSYYNEEKDLFEFYAFTKDLFIVLYFLRSFVKTIKEIYDWYLSLKYNVEEVQQSKNKSKRN